MKSIRNSILLFFLGQGLNVLLNLTEMDQKKMKQILIDLYKLKHPNTGLGQFSFYFGKEMIKQKNW